MVNLKKYYLQQGIVFLTKGDIPAEQSSPHTGKSLVIYSEHDGTEIERLLRTCEIVGHPALAGL